MRLSAKFLIKRTVLAFATSVGVLLLFIWRPQHYLFAGDCSTFGPSLPAFPIQLNQSAFSTARPVSQRNFSKKPKILVWTNVFGVPSLRLEESCDVFNSCTVTYDRYELGAADAIVYHFFDVDVSDLPELPDYYSGFTKPLNVLLTQESYQNSVAQLRCLPKQFIHWTMTFMRRSHVAYVYGGYWVRPDVAKAKGFLPEALPFKADVILHGKHRPIFWTVSNCHTPAKREVAVGALQKYIDVDIMGDCAPILSQKNPCPRTNFNCDVFNSYYFMIIAENSICDDYVTEKYWARYHLPVVPIVMRRRIYEDLLPTNSFIAMDDFDGPKALAAYLHNLISHPNEYMKYFEWRKEGWARAKWNAPGYRIGLCDLCAKLLEHNASVPVPLIEDVSTWLRDASNCEGGEFAEKWAAAS